MTRINVVPPSELHAKHLVAEYRELPRVFALVQMARRRGETPNDRRNPRVYTLGTGHVRFFYPRLLFLRDRYLKLVAEMQARDFHPNYTIAHDITRFPTGWVQPYEPTPEALALNRGRIAARSPWLRTAASLKGTFDGTCNVTACQKPIQGQNHWNSAMRAYYCGECARGINFWSKKDSDIIICTVVTDPNNRPALPIKSAA